MYVAERHFENEDDIKNKIVDGYRRGVCDSNGKTLKNASPGGSCFMPINEEYRKNYDKIDWTEK